MLEEVLLGLGPGAVYPTLFLFFILEGPAVNFIVSALAATSSFLNIWVIFFLVVLGDVVGDVIYFILGRTIKLERINSKVHSIASKEVIQKAKNLLESNLLGFMFFIKLFSITAVPGILYLGYKKTSWKKFLFNTVLLAFVFDGIVSFLAYNSVITLERFVYFENKIALVGAVIVGGLIIFLVFRIIFLKVLKPNPKK